MSFTKILQDIGYFINEDGDGQNDYYNFELPESEVECNLFFKESCGVVAGLPYFLAVFKHLHPVFDICSIEWKKIEGKRFDELVKKPIFSFNLPFNTAISGERLALNLLQRASSIASMTYQYNRFLSSRGITLLDTRKTTPGLRSLEKYAVRIGGGSNHRFSQSDVWMIKDNHKSYFGGVREAITFFRDIKSFYCPIVVEVHSLDELQDCIDLKIHHVLLDNFSTNELYNLIEIKPDWMTYEVSGGINLDNIESYAIEGIDAISVGAITNVGHKMDFSLKFKKV
ncbi:carboxylating nicotinate-nucleotide diphosphorylase [Bacteriovoracaceae bacterium]|nr:carboxylating nicotinate-nucleotide diphosphorylase [Bacteriovoracaceae bacterium]